MPQSNNPITRDVRDRRNGRPKTREKTAPQVATASWGIMYPELATNYPTTDWFRKVRVMRKDPTISLVRDLVLGPILSSEWSVGHTKAAPAGAVEFITEQVTNLRSHLITHSLTGWMDFGWQAFEPVWTIDRGGNAVIDKLKPLLAEKTRILIDTKTGEYLGTIQNVSPYHQFELVKIGHDLTYGSGYLKAHETILTNINVEGTYWYGRALMENEIIPYDGWKAVNDAADRYDRKIAGSHWVIHYPLGESPLNGTDVDNFIIAQALIRNLESSGAIAVPRHIEGTVTELNADGESPNAWKIELLSDSTNQQSNFIDRLKYYDTLKVRALGFPERSVIEGKFGTKSEAEVHSDLAVIIAEYRHQRLTEQISYQLINSYMRYNYGIDTVGSVYLKPAPIADDVKTFLRQVFTTLMQSNPEVALNRIDSLEVKTKLGLPMNDDEDDDNAFEFPEPVAPPVAVPGGPVPGGSVPGKPGATNLNPVEGENTRTQEQKG